MARWRAPAAWRGSGAPMRFFTTLALACSLLSPAWATDKLTQFSAYYDASTNGISGNAERHLISLGEERYRLNISLEAKVGGIAIGDLEQASELLYIDSHIRPQNYSYQVSGLSSDVESVSFNWEAGVALSADEDESWNVAINDYTFDELSYQLALAMDVAAGSKEYYEYQTVDGGALDQLRFRTIGEEILDTPLGRLRCIKLERVREDGSNRATLIWLAKDWSYLLTRIEQTSSSGLRIKLDITNAIVDGQQVTGIMP